MAFPKSKTARSVLLLLFSALIIFFISAFLLISVYIPSEIRNLIKEFSKENNIALSVNTIKYNPFTGVTGEQIKLGDLPDKGLSSLDISTIIVRPELIRSLMSGKLVVDEIVIKSADLRLTEKIFDIKPEKNKGDKKDDSEGDELPFEINKLRLNDLKVSIDGKHPVNIDNLDLTFDRNEAEYKIGVFAKAGAQIDIDGELKLNIEDKKGNISVKAKKIKNGIYLNYLSIPQNISGFTAMEFSYGDVFDIRSSAYIEDDDTTKIANLDIDAQYIVQDKKVKIESADLGSDFATFSLNGDILINEPVPVVSAKGKFDISDVGQLSNWVAPLKEKEMKGSLSSDNISLTTSSENGDINVSGKFESESISFHDIGAGNISSDAKLKIFDDNFDLTLGNIKAGIFGGSVSGVAGYSSNSTQSITAELNGSELGIEEIGKHFDLPVSGTVEKVKIDLTADTNNITSEILLTASNIKYGEGENILKISGASTSIPVNLEISDYTDGIGTIELKGKNTGLNGFYYYGVETESAKVSDFTFSYPTDLPWKLNLSAEGNRLSYPASDVILSDYNIDLELNGKEEVEISGVIESKECTTGEYSAKDMSTGFNYISDTIKLTESRLLIPEHGLSRVEKTEINLQENGSYEIALSGVLLNLLNGSLQLGNLTGELLYSGNPSTNFQGIISSGNIGSYEYNFPIQGAKFNYFDGNYRLEKIKTAIFNGSLNASGSLDTTAPENKFSVEIGAKNTRDILGIEALDLGSFSLSASGRMKGKENITGSGKLSFSDFKLNRNNRESVIRGSADINLARETIQFENGFIESNTGDTVMISGQIHNLFNESRGSNFTIPGVSLSAIGRMISPLLPDDIASGSFSGNVSADINTYNLFEKLSNWRGSLKLEDAGFAGSISKSDFSISGVNGVITLKDQTQFENRLEGLMGKDLVIDRDIYREYAQHFREKDIDKNGDFLRINEVKYGFLTLNNLNSIFEVDKEKINLLHFKSDLYNGRLYGNGVFRFGAEEENYNLSLLVDDISLKQITNSLPSMQNYISGVVYGLLWFTVEDSYWTVNGPFSFWAKDSEDEKRTIGRALLEKLGAKSRFFTRSSRRYDKGIISGYIKDGIMTFKEFEISNKILGYEDLLIKADEKMNSISIKHLLSVIRELARRASSGGIQIDYENKKK